ncbi:3958_t:CDS:2, partial [Ambispora gerdemannii]
KLAYENSKSQKIRMLFGKDGVGIDKISKLPTVYMPSQALLIVNSKCYQECNFSRIIIGNCHELRLCDFETVTNRDNQRAQNFRP